MQNPGTDLFQLQTQTRVVQGAGCSGSVGELARALGARKVLLVTDAGIVSAGHAGHVQKHLEAVGVSVTVFDRVKENPTTRCVDDCLAVARSATIDTLIGLGGGSSMDTAKGCNFLLTNGGRMQDYWGVGKASKPMLPFIAIPTTAGTGSELQSAALIADDQTHQKMACLDPKCAAAIAILDPALTLSQPPRVTACTGIDALAHALESAVTTKRNESSRKFSGAAFSLCVHALPEVLTDPTNLEARSRMQLGAAYAGAAIENSMLGAAHAAANPLTAHFGVVHGLAVGLMLPYVVGFNAAESAAAEIYQRLAVEANLVESFEPRATAVEELEKRLRQCVAFANLPQSLSACGVERTVLPTLAEEAAKQWTAGFNPRPVGPNDFQALYEAAFD